MGSAGHSFRPNMHLLPCAPFSEQSVLGEGVAKKGKGKKGNVGNVLG